jgi:putative membrane protein
MGGSPHVDATVPTAGAVPLTDAQFVIQAAQMGMAEVRMGELGVRMAQDEDVQDLAAHLVDDHDRANTELSALAARKGYKVPSEVGPTEQAILSSLMEVDRASFDDRFRQAAQQSHQRALRAYRSAAAHVSDPDLRAFAQKQIPILEHHLAMSRSLETGTAVGGSHPDSF